MLGTVLKLLAYSQAPKSTFAARHPIRAAQAVKTPFDLRTAYAPRLVAVATAALVAPLAYRLGKRAGAGTLWTPRPRVLDQHAADSFSENPPVRTRTP